MDFVINWFIDGPRVLSNCFKCHFIESYAPRIKAFFVDDACTATNNKNITHCSGKRKQHAPVLLNSNSKLDGICTNNFQNHLIDDSGKIHNLHINKLNIQSNTLMMPSSSKTEFASSVLLAMSDLWSQRVTNSYTNIPKEL